NSPIVTDPWESSLAQQQPETARGVEATPVSGEMIKITGNTMTGRLYFPTGEASTSAVLLEKAIPVEVRANSPFNYDIKVTNVAKLKLEGVEVLETLPGTFKVKDVTEGSADGKPNTVTYQIGALNPGESKIVRLSGTATQSGPLGMCMSARYNTSLCMATNVVSPALKLTGVGPTEAMICDQLSYKFTVTNAGSGQAKNVKIDSVLPDGLTTQDGKASVVFDAGTLAAGESREYAFTAKAAKTGAYAVKGNAKADDNLASESSVLNTTVRQPVLEIIKRGPDKAFIGQQIAYEITVTNKGDAVAKNVVVFDSLPNNVTVQATSEGGRADATGKVRWVLGDIAPNASKKVAVVISSDQPTPIKSAASVSGDCADFQAAVVTTNLIGVPAILMEVSDGPDPVRVGDQTTYTIEVTNQGTAAGTNIKLVCKMEDQMQFVSATGDTKEKVEGKTITFAPIGSLPPKAKATYKVVVKANAAADVRFTSSITSEQLGRPVDETEATTFFGN
ncbi:MAG TPA: CARDB domain-containing protein, partial [Tepidisphaeraceae bacterium]